MLMVSIPHSKDTDWQFRLKNKAKPFVAYMIHTSWAKTNPSLK
jgi:hypothetical protein